jgi:hypothetical protein
MSLIENLLVGAVSIATLPVAAAVDILTIGSDAPSVTGHNARALGRSISDGLDDLAEGNIFTDDD